MATRNRGVIVATAQTVVDAVETELDQISETVIESVGLVDRMGERQASALDMTWLRQYRMWREWVGEREARSDRRAFQSRMYSRKFEDAIRIPIEDIEDGIEANFDPQGEAAGLREGYENLVEQEHQAFFEHALDENFVGGTVTGPYGQEIYVGSLDGEPLLSDSHPYYETIEYDPTADRGERMQLEQGGTYSNLFNYELTQDNLWELVQRFREQKHYTGRPANMGQPNILIVPPALEQTAREILEKSMIFTTDGSNGAAATDNVVPDMDIVVNNYLQGSITADFSFDSNNYTDKDLDLSKMWHVANTRQDRKPFIHWDRKEPEIQRPVGTPNLSADNPAEGEVDYLTYKEDAAEIGARARFGVSFGVPQVIAGSLGGVTL
jgi:phage major head subunit gpT-like protein